MTIDSKENEEKLPKDTTPIISINETEFTTQERYTYCPKVLPNIDQFRDYTLQPPKWQQLLIRYFKESVDIEPLINFIQNNNQLIIASDGSKSRTVSGGAWIVADETGREIASGYNLDFGGMNEINSNRAEGYGILSVLVLLNEYSKYFFTPITSKIVYYGDNKEIVLKLNQISTNREVYSTNNEIKDLNDVLKIQIYMPTLFEAQHVRGHQDRRKSKEKLTMTECLNIKANKIIGSKACPSKAVNIKRTPIGLYVNKAYIPNNYVKVIRAHCGSNEASKFLQDKDKWSKITLEDIK